MSNSANNISKNEFNWDLYADGWTGAGLKRNKRVKTDSDSICFSHEAYAQKAYKMYTKQAVDGPKELNPGTLSTVTDLNVVSDTEVLATVMNGANNIIIDLTKEAKFFNLISSEDNEPIDRVKFVDSLKSETFKRAVIDMGLNILVNNGEKASLWDGYVTNFTNELKAQITKPTKAYLAHIDGTNNGGFIVTIMNVIQAFMPGSMVAINRVTDFESYIGKDVEVMIENYDNRYGFIVSHKKFLKTMAPTFISKMLKETRKNKNHKYHGTITGSTSFGVFVELNEFITGMIHKSCMSDELYERIKEGGDPSLTGMEMDVYLHDVDGIKVLLSDIPYEPRMEIIEAREKVEEVEKLKAAKAAAKNAPKTPLKYKGKVLTDFKIG